MSDSSMVPWTLPVLPPIDPMLARAEAAVPREGEWRYEPKWDGFRTLIFRDGDRLLMVSRNGQPLGRYFPELTAPLCQALPDRAVVDGEIVIATAQGLDFDALQSRLHPAESRIRKLAAEIPATVIIFDMLAWGDADLRRNSLAGRRAELVRAIRPNAQVGVTPHTDDADQAGQWFTQYEGAGLDGVMAKRPDGAYLAGERGWVKVKHRRTVDCVVGGYRLAAEGGAIGSLLLGLYDDAGVLHHVGHTASFTAAERRALLIRLTPLHGGESFGRGRTPGAPSRWSKRDTSWVVTAPSLVCEVSFDHLQGDRFRHAARFLRWREDRDARGCTYGQLTRPDAFSLREVVELPGSS